MKTLRIDVLNPKVVKLLNDLADLGLIAIRGEPNKDFKKFLEELWKRNEGLEIPSMEEIAAEVEAVRAERYAKFK